MRFEFCTPVLQSIPPIWTSLTWDGNLLEDLLMIQRAQKVLLTFNMDKKHSRLSLNLWYTGGQFHQHFTQSFYMKESQKHKETDSLIVFFALAARKRLVKLILGLF